MAQIRILDPVVVDRIAAGEVVERPASVVKELIENALDAGATRIHVRIESGGRDLIEVEDDGHGMVTEDARLAFAQHATSKIRSVDDLDEIATLGFRGEAIASIAAVSRVELTTGTGDGVGTRVRVQGGEALRVDEIASPRGTRVRVEDLFGNTPARRKHLRTDTTEVGRVGGVVEDFALLRPDVHLSLTVDGRERIAATPVTGLADRIHQIFGGDVADAWIPVEHEGSRCRVAGGVTSPEETRSGRRHVHLFVNGRAIADGRLAHAVVTAYDTLLPARRGPVAALFLTVPPEDVDVNVHPRKSEVRFVEPGRIYGSLRRAVAEGLAKGMGAPALGAALRPYAPSPANAVPRPDPDVREPSLPLRDWTSVGTPREPELPVPSSGALQPLAQYANTYIVAAGDDGLLIVDQHVAHERILYEQILSQRAGTGVAIQRLLVPETIELSATEAAAAEEHRDVLAGFGFEIEPFGGRTWRIHGVPELLTASRRADQAVRALLGDLAAHRGADAGERMQRELAASLACHSAVRANQPLSAEAMARLLADLGRCDAPSRCPHGRPVMLVLDHDRLEKEIGRRH